MPIKDIDKSKPRLAHHKLGIIISFYNLSNTRRIIKCVSTSDSTQCLTKLAWRPTDTFDRIQKKEVLIECIPYTIMPYEFPLSFFYY